MSGISVAVLPRKKNIKKNKKVEVFLKFHKKIKTALYKTCKTPFFCEENLKFVVALINKLAFFLKI